MVADGSTALVTTGGCYGTALACARFGDGWVTGWESTPPW
jgi:hypothetical protein